MICFNLFFTPAVIITLMCCCYFFCLGRHDKTKFEKFTIFFGVLVTLACVAWYTYMVYLFVRDGVVDEDGIIRNCGGSTAQEIIACRDHAKSRSTYCYLTFLSPVIGTACVTDPWAFMG